MAFAIGFDFRATLAFVTDTAPNIFWGGSLYPTSYGSGNAGWSIATSTANRNAALDHRLAGINFKTNSVFQIDLPAPGQYNVRCAFGDASFAQSRNVVVKDGAATLFSLTGTAIPAGSFCDPTNTVYTAAAWPGSNSARLVTMAGTQLTFSSSVATPVAYFYIEDASPPPPPADSPPDFPYCAVGRAWRYRR